MKSAGKARSNGLYRHIRTSKEIIRNLLNDSFQPFNFGILFNFSLSLPRRSPDASTRQTSAVH